MDGWKDDGGFARVAKCYTPSIHSFFILPYGCHMSPQFSQLQMTSLPIASSSPPGKPDRALLVHSLTHSLTSHSHLTLTSLSSHTPLRTPTNPYPLSPPLQQLDSSPPPASLPFPSPTILPLFHFTTASNHLHSSPAVYRYRKSIPRLLPSTLTDRITRPFLSMVINYEP